MTDVITDTAAYMLTYMSQMDCFLMSFNEPILNWHDRLVHKTLAVKTGSVLLRKDWCGFGNTEIDQVYV